ncbi:YqhR family membrane protein [Paenibacillus sp. LHD-117]|uniref:YqhR family membrane protein n=1 Tax=Paenibacillus sp. LHD-117 TaxID=3071412 RepID=UPI0027DF1A3A|nr:YqhR family membrane protein [Paenibacillus sp. LHD-117]MDQ6421067.1 YqhR family membrane protein [Paenibacillus sp. LHD-117]
MKNNNHSKRSHGKQERKKNESPYHEHHTNRWLYAIHIGLYAGLIWGCFRWMFYGLKFTTELPGFLLEPFFKHNFLISYWGVVIGILGFTVFSIGASLLYLVLLSKLRGPWPGVFYGIVWWALMFLAVGPLLGMTGRVNAAGWNTFFSELCIFTLWGLFIGYSIAFEFTDEASREPVGAK